MVAIEVIDTTIRATDRVDNVLEVETIGWDEIAPAHSFPMQVDGRIAGRVTTLSTSASFAQLAGLEEDSIRDRQPIEEGMDAIEPTHSSSLLSVESPVNVRVRFDGPARITFDDGLLELSFEQPTPVTLGFESSVTYPRHTVTVPETIEGVATAISQFSSSVRDTTPRRSANASQRHPPRVAFDDRVDIPEAVESHVPETGLELVVPQSLGYLLPAAPLSYYLGCRVVTEAVDGGRIRTDDGESVVDLGSLPAYQYEVAALLRRVFLVDSLVRYDQLSTISPAEQDLLSQLSFDPAAFVDASDVERLETCLALDFGGVSEALPEWHFVSYVEPTYQNVQSLPYLVRNQSIVMLPDAAPGRVDPDGPHGTRRVAPESVPARAVDGGPHGAALAWMSEDAPPDESLFVPVLEAYESATRYLEQWTEAERVVVVCTDDGRRETARASADLFAEHGPDGADVTVRTDVPRDDLRDLFETGGDLLHFVGDVADGFACDDGTLDPSTIERSNARLVFLDGPGGFEACRSCIRAGSLAGIARDRSSNAPEPADRDRLLGLLSRGFTVDQATRYAGGPDETAAFRALGDAFAQLTQPDMLYTAPATVDSAGVDRLDVRVFQYIPKAGFIWHSGLEDDPPEMCAQPIEFTTTGPEFSNVVAAEGIIPIVDGEVHWQPDRDPFYPFV
ncbi:hypothetical protein [Halovivax limisalsi]|uniref:hypothetical protein n=1 Tax=Halovivax limisalsi TaxID=1453760 RepID=UPI001FFC5B6F|nr:hypothetical protein [Halovivax limisalsi]